MVGPIPVGSAAVFAEVIADILNAAEERKDLAAGAAVMLFELAGEALLVAGTPVSDEPNEAAAIHGPAPGRPDRASLAGVALLGAGFRLRLVVARCQQDLMPVRRFPAGDEQIVNRLVLLSGRRARGMLRRYGQFGRKALAVI